MSANHSKRRRSPNWSDHEVNLLIETWKVHKKKLADSKRDSSIYEEMSVELAGFYCYRTAEEIKIKIDNMSKRFKFERTKEVSTGVSSDWRFYWQVDEVLGLNPSFRIEYIQESIKKKEEERAREENQATILMFKYPEKIEGTAEEEEKDTQEAESSQSHISNENQTFQPDVPVDEMTPDHTDAKGKFLEDLFEEYKETQKSLVDTDKKILDLLSNQNELIKTQNELCQTQNAILRTLLEKMD